MATRKQRKQKLKERRHEYETVWVDSEGNESEEPPEDYVEPQPKQTDGKRPKPDQSRAEKGAPQRSSRAGKTPLPPSWRRAAKRAVILGAVIFVLFSLLNAKSGGWVSALLLAILYTLLFIPFTYYVDRFAYGRWQRRTTPQPKKQPKKR
jgi:hypothetical protein